MSCSVDKISFKISSRYLFRKPIISS